MVPSLPVAILLEDKSAAIEYEEFAVSSMSADAKIAKKTTNSEPVARLTKKSRNDVQMTTWLSLFFLTEPTVSHFCITQGTMIMVLASQLVTAAHKSRS